MELRPSYQLSSEKQSIHYAELLATVCSTHYTALQIKNCSKSTTGITTYFHAIDKLKCELVIVFGLYRCFILLSMVVKVFIKLVFTDPPGHTMTMPIVCNNW